jgi:hypothetical protein
MIYFKLTPEIKDFILKCKEVEDRKIFLGCRPYCKLQVIASDELELARKLIILEKRFEISAEEFNIMKSNTRHAIMKGIHICESEIDKINSNSSKMSEEEVKKKIEDELNELRKDKIPSKTKYLFESDIDFEQKEKERQKYEKENNRERPSFNLRESNFSYGINLLFSFFLIVIGTYSVCKFIFNFSDSATFKFTLVTSVIVMFAETFLLLIKLDKESKKEMSKTLKKSSFAYRFNKDYRRVIDSNDRNGKGKIKKE